MKALLTKILVIIGLLLCVEASACDLSYDQATSLAFDHLGNHSDDFDQWFNDKSIELIHERIEHDGFYDEEAQTFFYPLLTIRNEYLKGSVWIEVYCDGRSRSRHYLEEI